MYVEQASPKHFKNREANIHLSPASGLSLVLFLFLSHSISGWNKRLLRV